MIELLIDEIEIELNEFSQNILTELNLAFIKLLNLPDIAKESSIRSFKVWFDVTIIQSLSMWREDLIQFFM